MSKKKCCKKYKRDKPCKKCPLMKFGAAVACLAAGAIKQNESPGK